MHAIWTIQINFERKNYSSVPLPSLKEGFGGPENNPPTRWGGIETDSALARSNKWETKKYLLGLPQSRHSLSPACDNRCALE